MQLNVHYVLNHAKQRIIISAPAALLLSTRRTIYTPTNDGILIIFNHIDVRCVPCGEFIQKWNWKMSISYYKIKRILHTPRTQGVSSECTHVSVIERTPLSTSCFSMCQYKLNALHDWIVLWVIMIVHSRMAWRYGFMKNKIILTDLRSMFIYKITYMSLYTPDWKMIQKRRERYEVYV